MRALRCLLAVGFATASMATIISGEHAVPVEESGVGGLSGGISIKVPGFTAGDVRTFEKGKQLSGLAMSTEQVLLEIPLPGMGSGGDQGVSGRGWLARWMALGGEGEVVVHTPSGNLTYPHRPAAFPQDLPQISRLPLSGVLLRITSFPNTTSSYHHSAHPSRAVVDSIAPPFGTLASKSPSVSSPMQACLAPAWPPIRWSPRAGKIKQIALVERGACDFATKVLAAQERGASAVIVGDTAPEGEDREDGRRRVGGLITMFSPEDTENIHIPSVFISRSAYLDLVDQLDSVATSSDGGVSGGIWVDIGDGADENGTLGGMVSFALLMPSFFLLATIAVHRIRVTRQKEQDRAPPQVVLSLPERVWQPDIVWEKDDSPLSSPSDTTPNPRVTPKRSNSSQSTSSTRTTRPSPNRSPSKSGSSNVGALGLPPISAKDIVTPPATDSGNPFEVPLPSAAASGSGPSRARQERTRSSATITNKRRYFSKDECAICMDEFQPGDIVRILPCGHVFHKEECDEWLLKWRKLCPTCRADVTLPPGSSTPQVGVRVTPVDGLQVLGDTETGRNWGSQARSAGRAVSGWMDRTRGRLFGRQNEGVAGGELDERTPLIRPLAGQRGENSV